MEKEIADLKRSAARSRTPHGGPDRQHWFLQDQSQRALTDPAPQSKGKGEKSKDGKGRGKGTCKDFVHIFKNSSAPK